MKQIVIGIDNGVSGTVGIIGVPGSGSSSEFFKTPVVKCLSYTKKEQHIQRIDWATLMSKLPMGATALLERPMVNPKAFSSTQSALRALEATIICLENLEINYGYIDSKEWQKEFISSSVIGHDQMKEASKKIGIEVFPQHEALITKHGDADGLLIAEYLRRKLNK